MKEEYIKINNELEHMSEEVDSVENYKNKLMNTEEELDFVFSKNKRLFQRLKYELNTGEMNLFIHDTEEELNHHKRKSQQVIEDELHSLNRQKQMLEDKEEELEHKKRWLSSRTDCKNSPN